MTDEEKKAIESLRILYEYMGENYLFGKQGIKNLKKNLKIVLNLIEKQQKENDRLSELTMFALLPPKLYNRELSTIIKEAFKKIVKENLNEDTHGIRRKIVDYWNRWN